MTWFRVDDSFYDHPKVFDLPDSAVALWTRAGAWAARNLTDGFVPAKMPARLCNDPETAVRALIDSGLWERTRGGYRFHDWAEYNPSKQEATTAKTKRSTGGRIGNHRRWHVGRGVTDPRCPYCARPDADRSAGTDAGTDRGTDAGPMPGPITQKRYPQALSTGARDTQPGKNPQANGDSASGNRSDLRSGERIGGDSLTDPPSRPDPSRRDGGSVGESSTGSRRATEHDDETKIEQQIIELLATRTGRRITPEWAARVRTQITGGRRIDNPAAYIAAAIRERPRDFLPGDSDPSSRSVAEAIRAARGEP
jgi:hypothetical protein